MGKKKDKKDYVWLECSECKAKNYRTPRKLTGEGAANKLELMKFCRKERKHTLHKENRKK